MQTENRQANQHRLAAEVARLRRDAALSRLISPKDDRARRLSRRADRLTARARRVA